MLTDSKRVVIVTGGGSGIGAASCVAFARAGYAVIAANRTLAKAQVAAETINSEGGEALPLQVDVSQSQSVERLIEETISRLGRIDVLLNSAGISPEGKIAITKIRCTVTIV